ncbi:MULTISPECIES: NUDIX domain-containing protein [unclassified Chelatococcus]|uniref:NUDIX hydrolase n=1 Tax=unclassified Chelatococcus TaxID=2638111 RepID=UPI001BD0BD48|nr:MULTISPECIES: NUDIX domain-containing protein [unclassified Chelatococcus]MBS7699023.1 NUDIX domain-containing protein [Chelatococcus sp. YT9]MBX3558956.1 NUDIX domain-containing protein [Chelatococcus sp.]
MRKRPSARVLLLDQSGCVLLFKFVHRSGPLAGRSYWATPGGAVEEGETFEEAALRELEEETGLIRNEIGAEVGRRSLELQLTDGETVWAEERFFALQIARTAISDWGWSAIEREVMAEHHWWSAEEIRTTSEIIFPDNLLELIEAVPAPKGV